MLHLDRRQRTAQLKAPTLRALVTPRFAFDRIAEAYDLREPARRRDEGRDHAGMTPGEMRRGCAPRTAGRTLSSDRAQNLNDPWEPSSRSASESTGRRS